MQNKELVKQHYEMGQKHMSKGDFEEAWKNFDKAISFGGKNPVLLDCKAAAMSKIPEWRQHAYQVTQDMITKYPKDFRGYYRQASVLHTLHLYALALAAVRQAVALGPKQADNERQFKAIQELRATITMKKTLADKQRAVNDEAEAARQKEERRLAVKARINYTHLLSRDILLTIAEQGMADDPGFIFRMGSVCREWRAAIVGQSSLWGTLVLGRKNPSKLRKKVQLYKERARGRLTEVKIMDDLGIMTAQEIAEDLRSCVPYIRRLTISSNHPTVMNFAVRWKGLLRDVNHLSLGHEVSSGGDLVYGMLDPEASSLRHLEIITGTFPHFPAPHLPKVGSLDGMPPIPHLPQTWSLSPHHLARLRTLRIRDATLLVACGGEEELLRCLPEIESFDLYDVRWRPLHLSPEEGDWLEKRKEEIADEVVTVLPNLRHYAVQAGNDHRKVFKYIHAPALEHVDVSMRSFSSIAGWLAAPGLALALPNLQSLDVSSCAFAEEDIIKALAMLPKLKFLNVSYCPVTNVLLEKLERRDKNDGGPGLVPALTGLSIAQNDQITGSSLKRFVLSRAAKGTEESVAAWLSRSGEGSSESAASSGKAASQPVVPKKRSMFAATPRASSSAPSQRTSKVINPSAQPLYPSPATPSIAFPPPATSSSPPPTSSGPGINWLCLDYCNTLEPELVDYLRKHVRFVSNYYGRKVEMARMKGKEKWAWDAAYDKGCGNGEGGCTLRRKPGTKDGWYVHHTCEPADVDEEIGWTQVGSVKQLLGSMPSFGEPVSP
ncbi:hypothetical protein IAT38_004908 [Cryptococcus sp. DSM 104549]